MSNYESHNLTDKELPFIYKRGYPLPKNKMFGVANWHENIEILYFTDGKGAVSDNAQHLLVGRGDIVVINSNHLHALAEYEETLNYRYLIIDRSFCIANGVDTNKIFFSQSVRSEKLCSLIDALDMAYYGSEACVFSVLNIRSLVLSILLELCVNHSVCADEEEHSTRIILSVKKAIHYIQASYGQNFSLDDVADFVGVNKYYLSHEFHKYTGYSFVSYVNLTRCKMAQRMLREGKQGVCEIAKSCGFENRSYFAKCFKKHMGVLPSECYGKDFS